MKCLFPCPGDQRRSRTRREVPPERKGFRGESPKTYSKRLECRQVGESDSNRGRRQDQDRSIGEGPIPRSLHEPLSPVLQLRLDCGEVNAIVHGQGRKIHFRGRSAPSQEEEVGPPIALWAKLPAQCKASTQVVASCFRGEIGVFESSHKADLALLRRCRLRQIAPRVLASDVEHLRPSDGRSVGLSMFTTAVPGLLEIPRHTDRLSPVWRKSSFHQPPRPPT